MTRRTMDFSRRPAKLKLQRILQALETHGPLTIPELMDYVPAVHRTMRMYLDYMQDQQMVHIGGWTRQRVKGLRSIPRAKYVAGPGKNRPKPRPLTQVEARRRMYARAEDPANFPDEHRAVRKDRAAKAHRYRKQRIEKLVAAGFPLEMARSYPMYIRAEGRFRSPTPDEVSEFIHQRDAGMSWAQVAQATGFSVATVRKYYKRITEA